MFPTKQFLAVKDHDGRGGGVFKLFIFFYFLNCGAPKVRRDRVEFHPVVSRSEITRVGESAVKFRFFFFLYGELVVGLWEA